MDWIDNSSFHAVRSPVAKNWYIVGIIRQFRVWVGHTRGHVFGQGITTLVALVRVDKGIFKCEIIDSSFDSKVRTQLPLTIRRLSKLSLKYRKNFRFLFCTPAWVVVWIEIESFGSGSTLIFSRRWSHGLFVPWQVFEVDSTSTNHGCGRQRPRQRLPLALGWSYF